MCIFDYVTLSAQVVAFQLADPGFVAIIGYIIVFYGFLADQFVLGFAQSASTICGSLLIFCSTFATAVAKLRAEPAKTDGFQAQV